MKNHAYLIMAHGNLDVLKKLIVLIDNPRNDIYLHIDKKTNFNDFDSLVMLLSMSKMTIIDSIDVRWGDISQTICELNLLEAALDGKYMYYHLLSGADLPIKSQECIFEFFDVNSGKEFVHFDSKRISEKYVDRIKYYHIMQKYMGIVNNKTIQKIIRTIIRKINNISIQVQRLIRVNRIKSNIELQKGANWFSITHELAKYVVDKREWIEKFFKNTENPDELFLQTLIINSNFADNLYCKKFDNTYDSCKRFIDWDRGNPYVWKEIDFDLLIQSDFLFARKFDYLKHPNIVNKIFSHLIKKEK